MTYDICGRDLYVILKLVKNYPLKNALGQISETFLKYNSFFLWVCLCKLF